jgi:hypothetical protein
MLTKRSKGLYVEITESAFLIATCSQLGKPFVVESLREFSRDNKDQIKAYVESLAGVKGAKYLRSHCLALPESRFYRKHSIESLTKAKDPSYFIDVLENALKIDPKKHTAAVINALNGEDFSADRPLNSQKELIICGAASKDFTELQDELVDCGIYPNSLQLGGLSSLASLKSYLEMKGIAETSLMLEISPQNSNLFLFSSEKVELCRPIPFGFNSMYPVIQKELGLKDESSAKKLFQSNTFDFTELGSALLKKALKELQASTGFYEVQTGQSIPHFYVPHLPPNLHWVPDVIQKEIGLSALPIDFPEWLESVDVKLGDDVDPTDLGPTWFGVFSLMIDESRQKDGVKKEK